MVLARGTSSDNSRRVQRRGRAARGGRSSICSAARERPVNDLVRRSACHSRRSPSTCGCSREVGRWKCARQGRQRLYRSTARRCKPIHDWVGVTSVLVERGSSRLDAVLEELKHGRRVDDDGDRAGTATVTLPTDRADPDHARVRRTEAPRLQGLHDAGARRGGWWHANRGRDDDRRDRPSRRRHVALR